MPSYRIIAFAGAFVFVTGGTSPVRAADSLAPLTETQIEDLTTTANTRPDTLTMDQRQLLLNNSALAEQANNRAVVTQPFSLQPASEGVVMSRASAGNPLAGFHLQRSQQGADADQGALFSILKSAQTSPGQHSVVTSADFYLVWNPKEAGLFSELFRSAPTLLIYPSAEGHISNNNNSAADAWRFRQTIDYYAGPTTPAQNQAGVDSAISAKYEADRDFRTQVVDAELLLTPTAPGLFIGKDTGADLDNGPHFRWRTTLGLELGQTLSRGPLNLSTPSTVIRIDPQIEGRMRLLSHAQVQFLDSLDVIAQDKLYFLPNAGSRGFNLFVTGVEVRFNPTVGLAITYTVGRDAPAFQKKETIGAALTVKF